MCTFWYARYSNQDFILFPNPKQDSKYQPNAFFTFFAVWWLGQSYKGGRLAIKDLLFWKVPSPWGFVVVRDVWWLVMEVYVIVVYGMTNGGVRE